MNAGAKQTPRIETAEDLERIVDGQNEAITGLGDVVMAMDARITLLSLLLDRHHEIFIAHGCGTRELSIFGRARSSRTDFQGKALTAPYRKRKG